MMKLELNIPYYRFNGFPLEPMFQDLNLMLHMIDARLELLEKLEKARNEG